MAAHAISSSARSRQLGLVGRDLSQHYGNKLFYSADEVKSANRRQGVAPDFGCWSYAAFNSRDDFDTYHRSVGESCDFVAMKAEIFRSARPAANVSSFDPDLSWFDWFPDWPSIDWPDPELF